MTASEIITKFELYMDDTTELSSVEELALLEKKYQKVSMARPWEVLKRAHAGTTDGTDGIDMPERFAGFSENANYSDRVSYGTGPVVYVGADFRPYEIISFSDRRAYRGQGAKAYYDPTDEKLKFVNTPSSGLAVEFDFIQLPEPLASDSEPWIPTRFQDILYHEMCMDDFVIQQSEKAQSYLKEHQQMAKSYMDDMAMWNAKLIQM